MTADAPRLALVGGGVSVVSLIELLARTLGPDIEALDLRLVAQDFDKLQTVGRRASYLVSHRRDWTVTPCRDLTEAAVDADLVILMIRVGGLEARRDDEDRSRRFGVPGDEGLGPGGLANAVRTVPVLAGIADEIRRIAPDAKVLNLVAPLGITTRLLLDHHVDAIGVCELPAVTERGLRAVVPDADLAYAGLNHLGWFWPRSGSPDALFQPAIAAGLVDPAVLGAFGAIPLKYYYWLFDPPAAARLGISRPPDRTASLIELRRQALAELAAAPSEPSPALAARPTPWFSEGLVPMVAAHLTGRPWSGFANVANGDLVPPLDPGLVVEIRAHLVEGRLRPERLRDPIPDAVARFGERVARAEDLVYRSAIEGDDGGLVDALVEGPHRFASSTARALVGDIRAGLGSPVGVAG